MKSRCLRTVKNHCKASKIHSSGDIQPGHKKGKIRKTDESVEICRKQANRDNWRCIVCCIYRTKRNHSINLARLATNAERAGGIARFYSHSRLCGGNDLSL